MAAKFHKVASLYVKMVRIWGDILFLLESGIFLAFCLFLFCAQKQPDEPMPLAGLGFCLPGSCGGPSFAGYWGQML